MGNVNIKQSSSKDALRRAGKYSQDTHRRSSVSSSDSYEDAPLEIPCQQTQNRAGNIDLEALINRVGEDAFSKAVLSFCVDMGGKLDSLDNMKLYDEFCSYTATNRQSLGVV